MDLTMKCRHWTPSAAFKSFAAERVQKLARFYPHLIRAELTVTREGERHQAELRLHGNEIDLLARGEDLDPRAAVDAALDKSERALARKKDRLKDRWKRGSARAGGARAARAAQELEMPVSLPRTQSAVRLVREAGKAPSMTADAAARRLLRGSKPFLLFTEQGGGMRVAYRRGDREVGVLELD